jgi:glycosyltransferase involved in cell wall biosynthesis
MKILIITNDFLDKRMASPAIRCWEMAKVLSKQFNVLLTCGNRTNLKNKDFEITSFNNNSRKLIELASKSDILIIHPYTIAIYPELKKLDKILILDLYAPLLLEKLESSKSKLLETRLYDNHGELSSLIEQINSCDYFLCASKVQKRLWTGMLTPLFLTKKTSNYIDISKRIIVVPFGIPKDKPAIKKNIFTTKFIGIDKKDLILIWGGGIWNWFDTETVIKGMKILNNKFPMIKLFFMSAKHPHPAMPVFQHELLNKTIELAENANLLNKTVFFNDKWIPYDKRIDYLLSADIGISTHRNHIETHFAFRTRILDYIYCNLPIICSRGDSLANLINNEELGLVIKENDPLSFAEAVKRLYDNPELANHFKKNIDKVKVEFYWSNTVESLIKFIKNNPIKLQNEAMSFYPQNSKYYFLKPIETEKVSRKISFKKISYLIKHERFSSFKKRVENVLRNWL